MNVSRALVPNYDDKRNHFKLIDCIAVYLKTVLDAVCSLHSCDNTILEILLKFGANDICPQSVDLV